MFWKLGRALPAQTIQDPSGSSQLTLVARRPDAPCWPLGALYVFSALTCRQNLNCAKSVKYKILN